MKFLLKILIDLFLVLLMFPGTLIVSSVGQSERTGAIHFPLSWPVSIHIVVIGAILLFSKRIAPFSWIVSYLRGNSRGVNFELSGAIIGGIGLVSLLGAII